MAVKQELRRRGTSDALQSESLQDLTAPDILGYLAFLKIRLRMIGVRLWGI